MKRRDFIRKIEAAGWTFVTEGGDHTKYVKRSRTFPVPRHNEVSSGVVGSWEKINRQIDEEDK